MISNGYSIFPQSTRAKKKSFKVAEYSLIGCGSLPFIGVLFKTRIGYKAEIWSGQNICKKHDLN